MEGRLDPVPFCQFYSVSCVVFSFPLLPSLQTLPLPFLFDRILNLFFSCVWHRNYSVFRCLFELT